MLLERQQYVKGQPWVYCTIPEGLFKGFLKKVALGLKELRSCIAESRFSIMNTSMNLKLNAKCFVVDVGVLR